MHPPTFLMRSNAQNTYGLQMCQETVQFKYREVTGKFDIENTVYTSFADRIESIHCVHMPAETGSELVPQEGISSF